MIEIVTTYAPLVSAVACGYAAVGVHWNEQISPLAMLTTAITNALVFWEGIR